MSSIAVRHDLRVRFGVARDQGARPTCLAFAMSDAHAAAMSPWSPLSCEYLFYQSKQRVKNPRNTGAATMRAAREALEQDGQPVETAWPYLSALPFDLKQWKPPAKVGPLYRRASDQIGSGFDDVWDEVASGKPVLVGMSISTAFLSGASVVDSVEPVDPTRRHAVVVAAAGERAKKKYLLVRNSWGLAWGLSGYAWLAERYMAPRILVPVTLN